MIPESAIGAPYNGPVRFFTPVFEALNGCGARYVVVGGFAVVLHGHMRLTHDVDLVVDLDAEPAREIVDALTVLGLIPRVPVKARDFANASIRERWVAEKGMQVFTMVDRTNPRLVVDLFVRRPFDFEALWNRAETIDLEGVPVRVAAIDDLIAMKRKAGRAQDLDDIRHLEWIRAKRGRPGSSRLKDAALDDPWRSATWEGAREAHLDAGLAATPAQRSEWLEEALALVERVAAAGPRVSARAARRAPRPRRPR